MLLPQSGTNSPGKPPDSHVIRPHPANPDAQKTIRRIDIDSTLNYSFNRFEEWSAVFIHRDKEGFSRVVRGTGAGLVPDGQRVDASLIEALRVALNEPPIRKPDLKNLGITADWVKEYRSAAVNNQLPSSTPNQVVARFFSDPVVIQRVLKRMFNDKGGDLVELRFIRFLVVFDGDSQVSFHSGPGSSPFMLPWDITRNGKEITTYNANISRALAALVPPETMNQEYVAGQLFPVDLVDAVSDYIESTRLRHRAHIKP